MAKVRIGNDGGACIIVEGVPYSKVTDPVQPTSGAINASPTTINISSYTWSYDDLNVWNGSEHRTWTPCEMGICKYVAGNQDTVQIPKWSHEYVLLYTAPSDGIIRVWSDLGQQWPLAIAINGVLMLNVTGIDLQGRARALRVAEFDEITIAELDWVLDADKWAYSFFLPDVYP